MDAALTTLLSPVILFFVLGVAAGFAKSDLSIPESIAKGMSLYLMAAIGLKGGVQVAEAGFSMSIVGALTAGLVLGFALPFLAYPALRTFGKLDGVNSGAVAAHYGSVSVVTFVTGVEILTNGGLPPAGYMVAVLALMETPAILAGLFLASRSGANIGSNGGGSLYREVFLNGSVVLLVGSFLVGMVIGEDGFAPISPMFQTAFTGVLCLFLLDMGLVAARRLMQSRALTGRLAILAIVFPLVNGTIGAAVGALIGLDVGSTAALAVLTASASYIAVPAAMRMALPSADAGLYLALSLGITFPFNITVGIPFYTYLATLFAGASV